MPALRLWTLDELTGAVAEALAVGYPGAPSARVRNVPDQRTIRWYVTRGLVDPPIAMRGRQALYGPRHLLQLVALKRRQAEGTPLASIQAELAGLPDASLARIAQMHPAAGQQSQPDTAPEPTDGARIRFWADHPAQAPALRPLGTPVDVGAMAVPDTPTGLGAPVDTAVPSAPCIEGTIRGIHLARGVILLLDDEILPSTHTPDAAALRAAAVPLLTLLNRTAITAADAATNHAATNHAATNHAATNHVTTNHVTTDHVTTDHADTAGTTDEGTWP